MLTPEQLAAIRARLDAATRGPWSWTTHRVPDLVGIAGEPGYEYETEVIEADHHGECGCRSACELELLVDPADAEFIAHAPTDLADLLTEVDRLTADLAAAAAKLATISDMCQPKTLKAGPWPSIWGRDLLRIIHPPRPAPAPAREPKPLDTGGWTPAQIWADDPKDGVQQ